MPDPETLTILKHIDTSLGALCEDADEAHDDRVRFGESATAAHADTRAAVARLEGRVSEMATGVTSARVETATAVGAANAAVSALQEEVRFTRRLVYVVFSVGGLAFVGVLVALMSAVLTLKGLDGEHIVNNAAKIVQPSTERATTPEGATHAP